MMHIIHDKVQTKRKIIAFSQKLFENRAKLNILNLNSNNLLLVNLLKLSKLCNIPFHINMDLKTSAIEENKDGTILLTLKETVESSKDFYKENIDQKNFRLQNHVRNSIFLDHRPIKPNSSLFKEEKDFSRNKKLNPTEIFEYWTQFKQVFSESEFVLKEIKIEKARLSKSIMNIGEKIDQEDIGDLSLINEDLLIKIFNYLELWQEKNVAKNIVIFLLQIICTLLKQDKNGFYKQQLNELKATKIMIVLIWEDDSNDELYLFYLIKPLILLLEDGQPIIQRTIYQFFLSNSSSQKFFIKIKQLIDLKSNRPHCDGEEVHSKKLFLRIFKLLQSFCFGHYIDLQNYLRYQTNSQNNCDLVNLTINVLISFEIIQENYEPIIQCFAALIEFIQGPCRGNQETLIHSKFLDYSCSVLAVDPIDCKIIFEYMGKIKYQCIITLHSLLECTDSNDYLLVHLRRALPILKLKKNLAQIYSLYQQSYNEEYPQTCFFQPKNPEIIIANGFLIYELLVRLIKESNQEDEDEIDEFRFDSSDSILALPLLERNIVGEFSKFGKSFLKYSFKTFQQTFQKMKNTLLNKSPDGLEIIKQIELKHQMQRALGFFNQNIAHIEIIRDKKLRKIFFPVLPICRLIPQKLKEEFLKKVTWTNTKTKILDLMLWSDKFIKAMHHEEKLNSIYKRYKVLEILMNHGKLWEDSAFLLNIAINLVILVSYREAENPKLTTKEMESYKFNEPYILYDNNFTNTKGMLQIMGVLNLLFASMVVLVLLIKRGPLLVDLFQKKQTKHGCLIKIFYSVVGLLQDFELSFYLLYILMLILGLIIHPFFMVVNMLDIIRIEIMSLVFKVLWISQKKFILFFFGFVIFEYYFSIIGYIFFWRLYNGFCDELWVCLMTTFDYTFKKYGSIGAFLIDINSEKNPYLGIDHENSKLFFMKFFFDNVQYTILPLLMVKVIAATLIDTFGAIKSQLKEKQEDEKQICFICGIKRETLDKSSSRKQGFYTHIKQDHYLWNYVFYRTYLELKPKNLFNGNESYVYEKIKINDISWFPVNQTAIVKDLNVEAGEKQSLTNQIEENVIFFFFFLYKEKIKYINYFYF